MQTFTRVSGHLALPPGYEFVWGMVSFEDYATSRQDAEFSLKTQDYRTTLMPGTWSAQAWVVVHDREGRECDCRPPMLTVYGCADRVALDVSVYARDCSC